MKILKFGGKSLGLRSDFKPVIDIIKERKQESPIAVVISAIGETTDILEALLEKAKNRHSYKEEFQAFKESEFHKDLDLKENFELLDKLFEGVYLLEDYHAKIKDQVLAQGELIAIKALTKALSEQGISAQAIDSRQFLTTDSNYGDAQILHQDSKQKTQTYFQTIDKEIIPIVSGFIASDETGNTTTLGRNGSNYSAALLADYLQAKELQNFTHVDGIFTANPDWIKDAKIIDSLSYEEANELATFGANILHAKTILPLVENQIPLRIYNTFKPKNGGTLISKESTKAGIKAITLDKNIALLSLEGRGLLGKVGVDGRIFSALANEQISVGIISQGPSERGVAFGVSIADADAAVAALEKEFAKDFSAKDIQNISVRKDVAVISIVGQDLRSFDKAYASLVENNIIPILFLNAATGKNVSLVVEKSKAQKALHIIHSRIFGVNKKLNLALFGLGTVGGTLVEQILNSAETIAKRKKLDLNIFAIADSKKILLDAEGIGADWKNRLEKEGVANELSNLTQYAEAHHLENLIAVDNTASEEIIKNYIPLVENGFNLVSSNKIANTLSYDFYKELRESLQKHRKEYLYETNVGAGLPLIDTIKLLHLSGENITKIRGVFSGSLSYIFNKYSVSDQAFHEVLEEAINLGYTEPDPREDLCGNDVGRKLLILARELDLENEFEEIVIQNLIPEALRDLTAEEFLSNLEALNQDFKEHKEALDDGFVLRYIGELSGDLQQSKANLEAKLVAVPQNSALGQLSGSDGIFEIYTESYGENPIIIQGAGAGAAVTARGVFGDILRLAK